MLILVVGLGFLPVPSNVFTKRDLSSFGAIADLGAFVPWGITCVAVGLLVFGLSFAVRGDLTD